jgi:hypothetical protein
VAGCAAGPGSAQLQAVDEFGDAELESDIKVAKLCIDGGDLVEAHLIDDAFDLEEVVGEQGDAPFVGVEAGGAGDELADFAGVFAAGAGMAAHEFAAFLEGEGPPIGADVAELVHGVKADNGPVGEVRVEPVVVVFGHVAFPLGEAGGVGFAAGFEVFGLGDASGGVLLFFGVLGPLGHGEVAVAGGEGIGAEGEGKLFFEAVGVMEIGGEQNEAQIGFGGDDAEGEELGFFVRANVLQGLGEAGEALAFFLGGERGPETVVDVIEQVLGEPAFLGDEGSRDGGGSGGGEGSRDGCGRR